MEKIVDPDRSGSGSTEIQISRPLPDIGISRSSVNYVPAILAQGTPAPDHKRVLPGGSLRAAKKILLARRHKAATRLVSAAFQVLRLSCSVTFDLVGAPPASHNAGHPVAAPPV